MIPKFRIWDRTDKRMFSNDQIIVWNGNVYVNDSGKLSVNHLQGWSIDDKYLMQSTGLFDKNGVEIFEGDVLDCSSIRGLWGKYFEVKRSSPGYWFIGDVNGYQSMIGFGNKDLSVVGNIYENPELVEDEE